MFLNMRSAEREGASPPTARNVPSGQTEQTEQTGQTGQTGQRDNVGLAPALRGLSRLVDAAIHDRRIAAEHDARRLERIHAALEFGAAHAEVFVDGRFTGPRARDLARRAVIGELAAALTMTERRVETLAGQAATLCRRLPSALRALRAGEIDYAQAVVIVDTVDALEPATVERRPELVSELDQRLTERAATSNTAELRRAARRLTERLQADSMVDRHSRARARRRVELEPARDGMAWLHFLLPAADALLIHDRLARAARASAEAVAAGVAADINGAFSTGVTAMTSPAPATATGTGTGTCTGTGTTRPAAPTAAGANAVEGLTATTRADLARDLLLHGVPPTSGSSDDVFARVRPTVHVTVPVQTLLAGLPSRPADESRCDSVEHGSAEHDPAGHSPAGHSPAGHSPARHSPARHSPAGHCPAGHSPLEQARTDADQARPEPALLDGYGPIDPETARRLTAHAPSFTRLLTHPVTGAVLDVDRTSYRVPADLRRWLQVRDETCRFPGCTRRAIRCELDHSDEWAGPRRGKTSHDNLAHLCSAHHHLKHDTTWSLKHLEEGTLEWSSPTGRTYRTAPSGSLSAPHLQITAAAHGYPDDPLF